MGHTELVVSEVGLGTVKWGRQTGVQYPIPFTLPTDQTLKTLLRTAREIGINLLDTAPAYGISEERIGQLLKNHRKQWIISTKVGEEWIEHASHFNFSKQAIQHSIDRSLKRLQTDYLDIVLVHSNGEDVSLIHHERVFETLALIKKTGKIRAFGMSTKTVQGGLATIAQADIAMVTFNATYQDERPVIQYAHEQKKGIFIKKALNSGQLNPDTLQSIVNEPGITSVVIGTINPTHLLAIHTAMQAM